MLAVSTFLEQARMPAPTSRVGLALGAAWGRALGRSVVRRLVLPGGARVVTVGGATLGGSGKTPLAIACAASIAADAPGVRVALVGHAYRAAPGRARAVSATDALSEVGDEALLAARHFAALAGDRPRVVVGPDRQAALDLASRIADVVVIDGVTQTAPVRAALALLAVDLDEPWGLSARVPPWGDLRAPVGTLLDAVDRVVAVHSESRGAFLGPELLAWSALASKRVGLVCALARPERVVRMLARHGILPEVVVRGPDHGPLRPLRPWQGAGHQEVDLWLATPKCALHAARIPLSAPLATLQHRVVLGVDLARALTAVSQGNNVAKS